MNTSTDERIAILLQILGKDVSESVLQQLPSAQVTTMKAGLAELEADPPTEEEVDEVLDEFHRVLRFALKNEDVAEHDGQAPEEKLSSATFEPTEDPFTDLASLHSFQIAGALREESASTIAAVLESLPADRMGDVIQQLPEQVRKEVFLRINSSPSVPQALLAQIVRATVDKGCRLDRDALSDPAQAADDKLAQVLRSMDRVNRQEMMQALEEADQETAARIKDMLYVFEDLVRVSDRSIQKLLAEIDSTTLAAALKNAEQPLVDKITGNLSKRARASLLEEIEYTGSVSSDVQNGAEKAICEVIGKLDAAGDLEMME